MEPNRDLYAGREQSFIKHLFLSKYLQDAAFKTFQSRSPIFNFVDGFAGPWNVTDKSDLSDTSFSQSIAVLQHVSRALEERGVVGLKTRFFFCEKKKKSFDALQQFASRHADLDIRVFKGEFENHLEEIGEGCKDGFTFTFIDPTGFNVRSQEIAGFLAKIGGEYLFNFMAEHINRYPDFDDVSAAYGNLLADPQWRVRYDNLPANMKNEQRILSLLKDRLDELGTAKFFPDIKIKNPTKNRIQMRLVLGTNSRYGVEVFRNTQRAVELREIEMRDEIAAGAQSLFPAGILSAIEQENSGFGCPAERELAKQEVLAQLARTSSLRFEELVGPVLSVAAINLSTLKDILVELRKTGEVSFDLPVRKRKPQDETEVALNQTRLL